MTAIRRTARTLLLPLAAGATAVVLVASPAGAHTGRGAGGLLDGLWHPLTGADHLLAMLSVGIVAAVAAPRRHLWVAPAAFVGGMIAGGTAGMAGLPLPGAEHLIVASVLLLGIAIAGAIAGAVVQGAGRWLVAAMVVAGIAHGHAHGAEAPASAHPLAYVGGFVLATAAIHGLGLAVGLTIRDRRALRVGYGAATVAAGALLLA